MAHPAYNTVHEAIEKGTITEKNFEESVIKAYGLEKHPKAKRAMQLAWDIGGGSGLTEILYVFDDLVELIS